jgi:hypothetical protein
MTHTGNLDLILSHRLAFSADEAGRALDVLHARAFLEGRTLGKDEALDQVQSYLDAAFKSNAQTADSLQRVQQQQEQDAVLRRQLNTDLQRLTTNTEKLQKGTSNLRNYFKSITDSYEILVTSLMRMQLKVHNEVYEVPRAQHTIPKFLPIYDHGVEWDGVLYVPACKHLYLIEAKSNLANSDITGMPARIKRTTEFIQLCKEGRLPPSNATYHHEKLCKEWLDVANARQVFGVVGAPGFTTEMLHTAGILGLLAVFFNSGTHTYHMQPTESGDLWCFKTAQYVHAFRRASMTEEEVADELVEAEAEEA